MEEANRGFSTKLDKTQKTVNEILREIENWRNLGNKSKSKLLEYTIGKELFFSLSFHGALMKHQRGGIQAKQLKVLRLQDILDFAKSLYETNRNFNLEIDRSIRILKDLLDKERAFYATKGSLEHLSLRTIEFFDGAEELLTVASAVSSEINEINSEYQKEAKNYSSKVNSTKELNDLNQSAINRTSYLERLIRSLDEEQHSIEDLFGKCELILSNERENIRCFLDILSDRGIDTVLLYKPFDEVVSQALSDIKKFVRDEETKYSWNEVVETINHLKNRLYKEVKTLLSENQFRVLLVLAEKSKTQSWFDTSALKDELKSRLELTGDQVEETLESLLEAKMLKSGVSLPI